MNGSLNHRFLLVLLILVLAFALTAWLGSGGTTRAQAAGQPAPQFSPLEAPTPTPNPKCGVAGGAPDTLAALKLSGGAPESGGYVWDALIEGNAVQVVRPCQYYIRLGTAPAEMRYDCYDIQKGRIQGNDLTNENSFIGWVQTHPGLMWLIGNEPNNPSQDGMTDDQYADMYEYYRQLITSHDGTAIIGIGGVSQVDLTGAPANRYIWLSEALNAYQARYVRRMPIDVWTFHMYNLTENDYSIGPIQEPIMSFVDFVRQTRGYTTQPIWLTEWGKLNGWLNPGTPWRGNGIPDDEHHPQMTTLMRNWAAWMDQEETISRWFWFDTVMGDWNLDFEFDQTGWLFQETNSFYSGKANDGSTDSVVLGVPPPSNHSRWEGALFEALGKKTTVRSYDASQNLITLSSPITPTVAGQNYKIFLSSYPTYTPNALGQSYIYLCNPGLLSKRNYLPTVFGPTSGGASAGPAATAVSPAPAGTTTSLNRELLAGRQVGAGLFDSPLPPPTSPSDQMLVDDFEYDDSPINHNWFILHPQGELSTIQYKFDSRKLMTTILHGNDRNFSFTYPGDPKSAETLDVSLPFLSFEWADYDGWWVSVDVVGNDGQPYLLRYRPNFARPFIERTGQQIVIEYGFGEGSLDNQWHTFGRNLSADLTRMAPGVELQVVTRLTFNGIKFVDDVMFRQASLPADVTSPHVDFHLEGTTAEEAKTFVSPVRFTALANDGANGSGVEAVFVRLDGRYWVEDFGESSVIEKAGEHVLETYAIDKAGNVSDVLSVKLWIDQRVEGR